MPQPKLRLKRSRPYVAALLSLLVTGLGQIFNRQPAKGAALLVAVVGFYYVAGWTGLLHAFAGLVGFLVLGVLFVTAVVTDAFRTARLHVRTDALPKAPLVLYILSLALVAVFVSLFDVDFVIDHVLHIRAFRIPAVSMEPTLKAGDRLIAEMRAFSAITPSRGDLIVFTAPPPGNLWVKRVIGLPGDEITGDAEQILVNGRKLEEPYVFLDPKIAAEGSGSFDGRPTFGPIRVPEGKLFLVGDNRYHSFDSRYAGFGLIDLSNVKGRPLYLYYAKDASRIGRRVE
ncbi:MAG: signal peptidase I [Acidobacteria bacterium]|nr:signal peptidase I [Acidobacteriota bacterium]